MGQTIGIVVGLVVLGLVLMFFELLTASFGVMTLLGLSALGLAVWQAFTISKTAGISLTVGLAVGLPFYIALMVKLLPRMPLSRRLFLGKSRDATAEGTPEAGEHVALVGHTGVAETPLRPAGAVRIDGRRVVARAERGIIPKGAKVKVIRAGGTDVVVREVCEERS